MSSQNPQTDSSQWVCRYGHVVETTTQPLHCDQCAKVRDARQRFERVIFAGSGRTTSLNGGKVRPLTAHALKVMRQVHTDGAQPCALLNPGTVDRLVQGGLALVVSRPSPFPVHKGGQCPHLALTAAGRAHVTA